MVLWAAVLAMPTLPAWLRLGTLLATVLTVGGCAAALLAPHTLGGAVAETLAACRRPRQGAAVLILSLVFQVLVVAAHALLGWAMGLVVPPGYYVLAGTLVAVVAMAPISINGVGTRDAAYVFLFGLAGVPRDAALAFALVWLALLAVCGAVGGVLFALLAPGEMGVWRDAGRARAR
ncbi:MAG: lysylphosphatidylglycerol synthase domain-containing protein [Armatimonadota bacterium]|nr:lysylphosphatidylglycerol synthase domain-containing protein [Armatimonadota bacterium]